MAKVKFDFPIDLELTLDKFGNIRVSAAVWPSLEDIQKKLNDADPIKLALIKRKLKLEIDK
jgi:hypothetical protein